MINGKIEQKSLSLIYPIELVKVLKNGGTFLTQQVSEADKLNLKEAFGRGRAFDEVDGTLKERYIRELKDAGFIDVQSYDYDAIEYFQTQKT